MFKKFFNVIFVISGVIASFWRVFIKFRWHGQKLTSVVNSDLRIWSSANLQKITIKRRIFKQNWTNFHCCPVQKAESRTTKSLLLQDWVFRLGMLHIHIPILRVFTTPFPELKRPYLGSFFRVRQVTLPEYGISAQKYWRRGFHIDVYYCYDFTLNFAQWLLSPYFFLS